MESRNTIVLMGGGLDSSYVAANLCTRFGNKRVMGLHFDYGQPSAIYEWKASSRIAEHLGINILQKSFLFPTTDNNYEVKCRNLLFILAALPSAMNNVFSQIALGIHKGSLYYDTSRRFAQDAQRLIDGYYGGSIQITTPLINLTKVEIWEIAQSERLPIELIYSCDEGKMPGCGNCPSCKDLMKLYAHKRNM